MRLSDEQIERLEFKKKDYKKHIGRNLYLVVTSNHWKEWWVNYILHSSKRSLRIGNFPQMNAEQAWARAMEVKRQVMNNENPAKPGDEVIRSSAKNNLARYKKLEKRIFDLEKLVEGILKTNEDLAYKYRALFHEYDHVQDQIKALQPKKKKVPKKKKKVKKRVK